MDLGIQQIILRSKLLERNAIYQIKLQTKVNAFDLDILLLAHFTATFSIYNIRKHFPHTNVQQIRRSVFKLIDLNHLDKIRDGSKNRPALYWINESGKFVINEYLQMVTISS